MRGGKNGQVNVYFLMSIALFISLSIYLIFILIDYYPAKSESIRINSLYSKAYSLSELLIKDEGYPVNWDETDIERIGLASESYILDPSKIRWVHFLD